MNIQVTFNEVDMLNNIDRETLIDYLKNTITKEEYHDFYYNTKQDTLDNTWLKLESKANDDNKSVAKYVVDQIGAGDLLMEIGEVIKMFNIGYNR